MRVRYVFMPFVEEVEDDVKEKYPREKYEFLFIEDTKIPPFLLPEMTVYLTGREFEVAPEDMSRLHYWNHEEQVFDIRVVTAIGDGITTISDMENMLESGWKPF